MESNQKGLMGNKEEVNRRIWTMPIEEWEKEFVGRFLIELYKRKIISRNEQWLVNKGQVRQEFESYLSEPANSGLRERFQELLGAFNIGNLMERCKFLLNSKRGSNKYKINYLELFREKMLATFEQNHFHELRKEKDESAVGETYPNDSLNGKWQQLEYVATDMQELKADEECQTKFHCLVCQINFNNASDYHTHMQIHSSGNDDLQWGRQFGSPVLKVWSQSCNNLDKIYLKLECELPSRDRLILDKILVFKTHSVCCVEHTSTISFDTSNHSENILCIDKQMLNSFGKQTFIFILRNSLSKNVRIAEQHYYMPEFIDTRKTFLANLQTNLISDRVCEAKENLLENFPSEELESDYYKFREKQDVSILSKSWEFSDYILSGKRLTMQNHQGTLKFLLQTEDIERFSRGKILGKNVELQIQGTNFYIFKISPDTLSEEKLLQFDTVYLYSSLQKKKYDSNLLALCRNESQESYRGQIVGYENGYIMFTTTKYISLKQKYTIYGGMARLSLKLQYRALELLNTWSALDIKRFLFPQFINTSNCAQNCLILQNAKLYKDAEQLQAIQNICDPDNNAPYIIDGPSGTGKTSIIIETIVQLHERKPDSKILVLAPTEHACDEIAIELVKIFNQLQKIQDMLRIYSHLHELQENKLMDEHYLNLLKISNICGKFFYPAIDILHERRIVICTLNVAGSLSLGGFGRDSNNTGVYTHIFVDNATLCTEPEILMALANVLSPRASLILAGDSKQKPEHIYAKYADEFGLGIPLLHRLMQLDCYKVASDKSSSICTRLVRNYRSHPEIIDVCNRVYNIKMISMSNVGELSVYCNWYKLPNPMQPILFHHVENASSKMWNSLEVAMTYIKELMYFGIEDKEISENDIAIIINEKLGVKYLRHELKIRDWQSIEVDTLDNYAGRERNVIICVLNLSSDNSDIKNLNTMILFAKSVLIIIGDTKDNKDVFMESFISICRNRKMLIVETDTPEQSLKQSFNDPNVIEIDDELLGAMSSVSLSTENVKPKRKPTNNIPHLARNMKKGYNAQKPHSNAGALKEMMHQGPLTNKNINQNYKNNNKNKETGAVPKQKAGIPPQNRFKGSTQPKAKPYGNAPTNNNMQKTNMNEKNNTYMNKTAMSQQYGNNSAMPMHTGGGVMYPPQFCHPPPPPVYPGQLNYGSGIPPPLQQYNPQQQPQYGIFPEKSVGTAVRQHPPNLKPGNTTNNKGNLPLNQQQQKQPQPPQQKQQQPPQQKQQQPPQQKQQQQPQQQKGPSSSSQPPAYNDIFSEPRVFGEDERRPNRRPKKATETKPECVIG